jgi:hypothetical protein
MFELATDLKIITSPKWMHQLKVISVFVLRKMDPNFLFILMPLKTKYATLF